MVRLAATFGAASAALMLAACSTPPSLRTDDVQGSIASALAEQVGGTFTVTCPSAVPAEPGQRFTCSVTDGSTKDVVAVDVEVTDGEGGFTWQVAPPATASPSASPA